MQSNEDVNQFLQNLFQENPLLISLLFLISAIFFGFIVNRILNFINHRYVINRKIKGSYNPANPLKGVSLFWQSMKILLTNLQPFITFWFFVLGLYGVFVTQNFVDYSIYNTFVVNILFVIFVLSLTLAFISIINKIIRSRPNIISSRSILIIFIDFMILLVGLSVILGSNGIDISGLITTLGLAGLAVAIALRETLENFFAGLQVVASRALRVGNYIELSSGEEGFIHDINWRSTTLRTFSNFMVVIPNNIFVTTIIKNYSFPTPTIGFSVPVSVSREMDLERVKSITLDVAQSVLNQDYFSHDEEFRPVVRFSEMGTSTISFKVFFKIKGIEFKSKIIDEFIFKLHKKFQELGIESVSPNTNIVINKTP